MTPEQINDLHAGGYLDSLIALHIFKDPSGVLYENYSTDISDAWKVVEKITENNPHKPEGVGAWPVDFRLHRWNMNNEWQAAIQLNNGQWVKSEDNSAPLAICRAALLTTCEKLPQ